MLLENNNEQLLSTLSYAWIYFKMFEQICWLPIIYAQKPTNLSGYYSASCLDP
jgi:hypothetical protein